MTNDEIGKQLIQLVEQSQIAATYDGDVSNLVEMQMQHEKYKASRLAVADFVGKHLYEIVYALKRA